MTRRVRLPAILLALITCGLAWSSNRILDAQAMQENDPIAREVSVWRARLADTTRTDALWTSVKPGASAALDLAEQAMKAGRRWTALERLAAARASLVAAQYVAERPAETRASVAAFEAEWSRMAGVLGAALKPPAASGLSAIQPAAARALAEAAGFQVRIHYDASVIYGRATDADSGLFYLGTAEANRQFLSFVRTVAPGRAGAQPRVRSLAHETDALESALLAKYRPPVSIDRHPEFIAANSALKEARELDAAGLRYGALQRYLLAALRATLLEPPTSSDAGAIRARLLAMAPRVNDRSTDHTIARMFLERALTELDRAEVTPAAIAIAAGVANDVLPKYFAALEPARATASAARPPRVTVTLVRWPFT